MQRLSKVLGHRGAGSKPRLTQPSGGAAAEPTCHKGLGPDKAAHQDSKPQTPWRPRVGTRVLSRVSPHVECSPELSAKTWVREAALGRMHK